MITHSDAEGVCFEIWSKLSRSVTSSRDQILPAAADCMQMFSNIITFSVDTSQRNRVTDIPLEEASSCRVENGREPPSYPGSVPSLLGIITHDQLKPSHQTFPRTK